MKADPRRGVMTNKAILLHVLAKASKCAIGWRSTVSRRRSNQQIVEPIAGKNGPLGYLRLTLDTHTLATEAQQVDNTTNILRLMLLLSLAIGVVLDPHAATG